MEKIDYCKDDLYELIHRLITREINEIDFSDEYYIAFIYNSNYWNSSEELRGSELLLFNQLAEVSNYLVSFAEVKLSSDETSILKEKLRNTAIQISKKMCIYNLLEQYLHDKISTTDFCNKFYEWYDIGTYKSEMEQNKKIWLDELSTIARRYSEFSEDHRVAPKAFTTEAEIKAKVKEILKYIQAE